MKEGDIEEIKKMIGWQGERNTIYIEKWFHYKMELTRKQICFLSGKKRDGRIDILHNLIIYAVILVRINKKLLQNKIM